MAERKAVTKQLARSYRAGDSVADGRLFGAPKAPNSRPSIVLCLLDSRADERDGTVGCQPGQGVDGRLVPVNA